MMLMPACVETVANEIAVIPRMAAALMRVVERIFFLLFVSSLSLLTTLKL